MCTLARAAALSSTSLTASTQSAGGAVFGMASRVVTPPRAAAAAPVASSSLCVWPGSLRCTCRSTSPGKTVSPRRSASLSAAHVSFRPTRAILPSATSMSAVPSKPDPGSTTYPFFSNRVCFIRFTSLFPIIQRNPIQSKEFIPCLAPGNCRLIT